jgi:Ca-activated chloride channel family protein
MIYRRPLYATLTLFTLLFILHTRAHAQEPTTPAPQPTPDAQATPNARPAPAPRAATLRLLAYGGKGKSAAELKREDVRVYVDGAERPVTYFAREETPASYGLVVDNSGSLAPQINAVIAAARYVADTNGPADETFVVRFVSSDEIKIMQDFTSDKAAISAALLDMFIEGGPTAVLDAVYLSGEHVAKKSRPDEGVGRRRALVLITDGEDRASFYRAGQVMDVLRAGGVQVFAIGLTAGLDRQGGLVAKSKRQKSIDLLEKLTSETGGRVFFAEKVGELREAVEEIARNLHSEYVVGYDAPAPDGGKHKVEVKAFGAGGADELEVVLRPEPDPARAPEEKQKKKKKGEDKKKD